MAPTSSSGSPPENRRRPDPPLPGWALTVIVILGLLVIDLGVVTVCTLQASTPRPETVRITVTP